MTRQPLILALETSGKIGSVALALGKNLLAEAKFSAPLRHSAEIFPAIRTLMHRFNRKPTQIDHIYISVGPGSFTGLRIAVTIAKTIHLAKPAKIVALDTLDVIAANITRLPPAVLADTARQLESNWPAFATAAEKPQPINRIAAILDAKRNQFFIAAYDRSPKTDNAPHNTKDEIRDIYPPVLGPTQSCPDRSRSDDIRHIYPPALGRTTYGIWEKILPDSLMTAQQFLDKFADPTHPIHLLGDGILYHKDKFKADGTRILDQKYWRPRASKVHSLGWKMALDQQFADPVTLTPKYIRRPEPEEKWKKT